MKISPTQFILHNFWLKFFSIALATVIWLAIHYDIHNNFPINWLNINNLLAQEYVKVKVTTETAPGDTRVFKITPPEVIVDIVGEKGSLQEAAEKNIKAYVDLTGFRFHQSAAEEVHTDVPSDITVLEISPPTVAIEQVSP